MPEFVLPSPYRSWEVLSVPKCTGTDREGFYCSSCLRFIVHGGAHAVARTLLTCRQGDSCGYFTVWIYPWCLGLFKSGG
jgi:hypothetical protein